MHLRRPTNSILVFRQFFQHTLAGDGLTVFVWRRFFRFDVLFVVRIPLVGPVHQSSLEVHRETGRDIAIGLNLFVGPLACKTELTPLANVRLRPARVLCRVEFLSLEFPATCAL